MRTESNRSINEPFDATAAFRRRLELAFDTIRCAVGEKGKTVEIGEEINGNLLSVAVRDDDAARVPWKPWP